jgi:hypothetical protein
MQSGAELASVAGEDLDSGPVDFGSLDLGPIAPETRAAPSFLSVLSLLTAPRGPSAKPAAEKMAGPALESAAKKIAAAVEAVPPHRVWSADSLDENAADEEMESEAASFSYEDALRHGARVSISASPVSSASPRPAAAMSRSRDDGTDALHPELQAAGAGRHPGTVTIRMSAAECAQLRERAAEAELTLSGYVRSCVLEAEALRTQVKQALQELRSPAYQEMRRPAQPELRAESSQDLRGALRGKPSPEPRIPEARIPEPRIKEARVNTDPCIKTEARIQSQLEPSLVRRGPARRDSQIPLRRKFRNDVLRAAPEEKPPASERFQSESESAEPRQWWQMRAVGRSLSTPV